MKRFSCSGSSLVVAAAVVRSLRLFRPEVGFVIVDIVVFPQSFDSSISTAPSSLFTASNTFRALFRRANELRPSTDTMTAPSFPGCTTVASFTNALPMSTPPTLIA